MSQMNAQAEADAAEEGDPEAPPVGRVAVSIACLNKAQRADLVTWMSKKTMRCMGHAAVVSSKTAEERLAKCVETIQKAIKGALESQSGVEDAILQLRMEKLADIIALDSTSKNGTSLCLGAAGIATRLLQLLKGEEAVMSQDNLVEETPPVLMTADDVSAMVNKGLLADEFSDCFKRVLMVSQSCSPGSTEGDAVGEGVSLAEIVVVFVALMMILEVVLKIEKQESEDPDDAIWKSVVLPDGVPQSVLRDKRMEGGGGGDQFPTRQVILGLERVTGSVLSAGTSNLLETSSAGSVVPLSLGGQAARRVACSRR